MRVLLLGGTGFLGRSTARELAGARHEVVVASRSTAADVVLDVESPQALMDHFTGARYDAVVNLVGAGLESGTADHATMRRMNSELPVGFHDLLAKLDVPPRVVHAASSTERLAGQALDESDYSRSKHDGSVALRSAARTSGATVTILAVHNSYGPGQPSRRFVAAMADGLRSDAPVTLNYPHRVRDFVFVDDVAASIAQTVEQPAGPRRGTGRHRDRPTAAGRPADRHRAGARKDPGLVESNRTTCRPNPLPCARCGSAATDCAGPSSDGIREPWR